MTSVRCGGFVDPGWEHGTAQDEKKKKVRCNYCGKVVSGGIYRLKQHLARVSGEVTYCEKAPEDVCLKMKQNLEGCRGTTGKKKIQYHHNHNHNHHDEEEEEDDDDDDNDDAYLTFPTISNEDDHQIISYNNNNNNKIIDKGGLGLRSLGYVDPGWEHGIPQDDRKKKVKCNYCDKIVSGGINRFKQHLARIPGEVAPCKTAPEEVYLKIKENMKWHRTGRRHRRPPPPSDPDSNKQIFYSEDENIMKKTKVEEEESKGVISAISKFFYYAGIPTHAANSPYFHKMLEMMMAAPPRIEIIDFSLQLDDEISIINNHFLEYKASWPVTGCSILADTWKDTNDRTIINILVSCPRGLHFLSSIDATEFVEDPTALFKFLDKFVHETGEENVVQVITENTPSYQAAGKMLEEKRQNLYWTPCAVSCIEQMLEDFMKIKWVAECVEKGQKITKLVYNQMWLWNLLKREYIGGEELVKVSLTRHHASSSFLTLQSLMDHRVALKRLFQSSKWRLSRLSKCQEGEEVEKIVTSGTFWKKLQYLRRSVDPILELKSLSMPFIYNEIYRAKLAIKTNHGDDARKYANFWSIIDNHSLNHPLYLAAYFLNPSYRYRPDFLPHPEVVRGLNSCIVRFEPNNARRVLASKQISDFCSAKADFGTDLAISTRTEVNPAAWWQQHGINCLELQQIAVRILSQTGSCFGCEHNWSIYDEFRKQSENRLAQKQMNDLIYVHYNLRLRERKEMPSSSSSSVNILQERVLHDWIVKPQKQQDEESVCSEIEAYGLMEYEGENRKMLIDAPNDEDEEEDEDDDLNFLGDGLSDS